MNTPTRKISTDEALSYILNLNDIWTLKSMKATIDARIGLLTEVQGPGLNTGDRVKFINQRSRKLPIGTVVGTVEKVNVKNAKVRVDVTNALWNIPFTMLTKI